MQRKKLKLGNRNRIVGRDGVYTVEIDDACATVRFEAEGEFSCSCGMKKDCPHIMLIRACGFAPPPTSPKAKGENRA